MENVFGGARDAGLLVLRLAPGIVLDAAQYAKVPNAMVAGGEIKDQ